MRRVLLFAAITAASLASCSKEDVIDVNKGGDISFLASLDKAITRTNVTTLQSLTAFNVTAIGNNDIYFRNMSVTSNGESNNWTTTPSIPWPNFDLSFFAYAPQTPGGSVSITKEKKEITGFSPAQTVEEQKDVVISFNTGNRDTYNTSSVPMNFKHILSQIEIKAKCSNPNVKIEVLGVKIANVAAKADFTFPEAETNSGYTLQQSQWKNWAEKNMPEKAYIAKGRNFVTLGEEPQSLMFGANNFMLIPQNLTEWNGSNSTDGAYLSVLCRIYIESNGHKTLIYPQPSVDDSKEGKYAFAAVGIDTDWQPGKKYTYTLTFCGDGGGAGKIDPNPTDPTDSDNIVVDPTPVPDGNGGDTILGNPIKFTVTVDEWTNQSVNVNM